MPKVIIMHEVDDVDHWLASPKRAEVFSGIADNIETYVHPTEANKVGLSMAIGDMDALDAVLKSDAGAAAMKYDGVRTDTIVLMIGT